MKTALFLIAIVAAGCAAFEGPATKIDDTYLLHCGDDRCDPRWFTCSNPWYPPVHCVASLSGVSRDAGADVGCASGGDR